MTYSFRSLIAGTQAIAETSATQKHELGTRVNAFDPTYGMGEFIYLKGVAATAAQDLVAYDERAFTTVRSVAATRGPVAVAMSANVATQFGWYQIRGAGFVNVAGGVVAAARVYLTATAGQVDDAVVAAQGIEGMIFKTADGTPAANQACYEMAYPSANANG